MAEVERRTFQQMLSHTTLAYSRNPWELKRLVRESVHLAGKGQYYGQEWEDAEGWHYEASNMPLKPRT